MLKALPALPCRLPIFPSFKRYTWPYTPHFLLLHPILLSLISKLISWSGLDLDLNLDFLDSVFSFIVIHCEKTVISAFIFSMTATKWRLHTWYERTNFTDGFWIQSFTLHSFLWEEELPFELELIELYFLQRKRIENSSDK